MITGYARWLPAGTPIPTRSSADLFAGRWQLIGPLRVRGAEAAAQAI